MSKLGWDAFVKAHGTGHCLTTGTNTSLFKVPKGVAEANGMKWPTVPSLITMTIKPFVKGDWAIRTESQTFKSKTLKGKSKSQRISITHLIFASDADCIRVAASFGIKLDARNAGRPALPCKTQHGVGPFEGERYGAFAKAQGYI